MPDYIELKSAKRILCMMCNEINSDEPCEPCDCDWMNALDKEPTADVAPVWHGRWIVRLKGKNQFVFCSECGTVGSPRWKRCPVCGAKMDGGEADA